MASIDYNEIFECFLGNVTDYDFVSMPTSDSYALMTEYLHKALAETYLRRLFSSLSLDDTSQTMTYEMVYVVADESDKEFIINAIAKWMVYEWLHKEVRSKTNTAQFFGGKEQSFYSQAQHISELRGLQDDSYKEARVFVQDRGWINNSYLEGANGET